VEKSRASFLRRRRTASYPPLSLALSPFLRSLSLSLPSPPRRLFLVRGLSALAKLAFNASSSLLLTAANAHRPYSACVGGAVSSGRCGKQHQGMGSRSAFSLFTYLPPHSPVPSFSQRTRRSSSVQRCSFSPRLTFSSSRQLSSSTVFGFTVGVAFFLSVIFFAIVTSVCRLMFNRRGAQPQNRWVRLEDGSSLQVPVGSRGSSYFGPVETLMRRQDEHGYVPARSGQPPREMSVDGGVGMSQFVAYDPPLARPEASESSYPPSVLIPGARPASTATDRSGWSNFTYVAAGGAEKMDDDDKVGRALSSFLFRRADSLSSVSRSPALRKTPYVAPLFSSHLTCDFLQQADFLPLVGLPLPSRRASTASYASASRPRYRRSPFLRPKARCNLFLACSLLQVNRHPSSHPLAQRAIDCRYTLHPSSSFPHPHTLRRIHP
jgi:hypothetical protein